MRHARFASVAVSLIAASCSAFAQRAVGPLYDIVEPDLVVEMKRRAKEVAATPEFQERMREGRRRSVERVVNPEPVAGLSPAFRTRTFFYDPSIIVEQDILAPDGQVIAPRGMRVNPLEQAPWKSTWFFFDGRDVHQVAEVRRMMKRDDVIVKPILVAGSPIELRKELKQRVFFDQHGLYIQQFGIQAVPATIRQDGLRLRIDEFPAREAAW